MKILIVFEDQYGIADIFSRVNGIKVDVVKDPVKINDELYVSVGNGNAPCLGLSEDLLSSVGNIDTVISVFDIDKLGQARQNKVMLPNEFCVKVRQASRRLGDTMHLYMPIVYNAETVMLHQYLRYNGKIDIVDIVHPEDTYKLHLNLLQELIMEDSKKDRVNVKRVREYLDFERLLRGFKASTSSVDRYFKRWLLSSFDLDLDYFVTAEEVIGILDEAQNNIDSQLCVARKSLCTYKGNGKKLIIDLTTEGAKKPILLK